MAGARMRRVDEAMRVVLSDAISKEIQDPRVGFVTVTGVKTSPDLRHARVYVSVLGDALRLKHTPSLSFIYDESIDHGMRISELINGENDADQ
jgi:ribosome-binding factor A